MFEHHDIYEHAASKLANMELPTFGEFDEDDTFDAFGYRVLIQQHQEWFPYFQSLIEDASNHQVKIVEHPFYTGIKGINRTYKLTNGTTERNVVIATGIPPVLFHS